MRTNGSARFENNVTVFNPDVDDALNVTLGGMSVGNIGADYMQFVPGDASTIFTIRRMFNISSGGNVRVGNGPQGTVTILSTDVDDALNVSGAAVIANRLTNTFADADDAINVSFGGMTLGNDGAVNQQKLTIYDGGVDKCSLLVLFDEAGNDYFLYINASHGKLMISNATPTTCGEGVVVGGQSETEP